MDFDYSGDIEKDEFESIPLPDQVPGRIPIQDNNSLKSRTVQTLLNQNQDLMARLTVALKRNIELEQKIENQEDAYKSIKIQNDTTKDQYAIQVEKSKRVEHELNKTIEENLSLQKRHAELYTTFQDKISYIQTLSYKLHKYINYRKRIRGYVRPYIQTLKYKIESLYQEILILKDEALKKNDLVSELKKQLEEAYSHIQTAAANFERDQNQLVEYHERRMSEMTSKIDTLEKDNSVLTSRNEELKKRVHELSENEATLQNKSVYFERKFTDLESEYKSIYQQYHDQKNHDQNRIFNLEIKSTELSKQLSENLQINHHLKSENQTMTDQLQSLQLLYQDIYQKNEDLKKMLAAQDQMNKDLSNALSELRKKSELSEQKLLEAEEDFKRKLQSFQMRFYKKTEEPGNSQAPALPVMGQKELLDKIQNLLSEIQTGTPNTTEPPQPQLLSENGELE